MVCLRRVVVTRGRREHTHERGGCMRVHRCTGVIVSSGNETVWESVCRGVPVLTMPTTAHGEQVGAHHGARPSP